MPLKQVDLPGVGKRFSLTTAANNLICIVQHYSGKREIYFFCKADAEEPDCVFEMTEEEAREIGEILIGTLLPTIPFEKDKLELLLGQLVMEWIAVQEGSPMADKTIADMAVRRSTGASIIAIQREGKIIPSPDPYQEVIRPGDVLIVVGAREQVSKVAPLCQAR